MKAVAKRSTMHFTAVSLVSALVLALTTTAAPLEARQDALKPFEVTAVVYNSYNGRPGGYPCMENNRASIETPTDVR